MSSQLLRGLVTTTILLQICSVSWCRVTVSMHFLKYSNPHARDHEGKPCDPHLLPPHGVCDHYLEICVDKIERHLPRTEYWVSNCDLRYEKTGYFKDANSNTFGFNMGTVRNPVTVDIGDSEEGVAIRVRVMDHDSGHRGASDIVDYLEFDYLIEEDNGPLTHRKDAEPYRHLITGTRTTTEPTVLEIAFSVYCAKYYYLHQGRCTKYCKESRSEHFGQYKCMDDGEKQCFKGWKDEATNCTTRDGPNTLGGTDLAPLSGGGGEGNNNGLIIGLVLGIFFLILIIVIALALFLRERRKRKLKEQGTSAMVSTTTMGQQTHTATTDTGTGGSYANPAFSSDSSMQTDNTRNQRAAQTNGIKVMETGLLNSPPPYKVGDIPTGGSSRFNNLTYGREQVGAVGRNNNVENEYDEVGLNKKY